MESIENVLNEALGALRGIEWSAGSSPSREAMDDLGAKAKAALERAKSAGFEYKVPRPPSGPGSCDMDPMDPRFRQP